MGDTQFRPWTTILGAVVQIRFHQHHLLGAVLFGGSGNEHVPHGKVLPADKAIAGTDNQHSFTLQLIANGIEVVFV